jgi:hypothetical protein
MLTRDDFIDIVMERLGALAAPLSMCANASPKGTQGGGSSAPPPGTRKRSSLDDEIPGRKFLSEYDIRKRLTANSQELRIPKDSIISPLAVDWLTLGRIKIIRE